MAKLKQGEVLFFNANGCSPDCLECTKSHNPARVVVSGKSVYFLREHPCVSLPIKKCADRLRRTWPKRLRSR